MLVNGEAHASLLESDADGSPCVVAAINVQLTASRRSRAPNVSSPPLAGLRWRDLDIKRGHVMLDENKTDDPRSWALDPSVACALRTWKESYHADAEPDDLVFREPGGVALYTLHLADDLRRDLHDAGVKRPALFERSDVRRPIRVHDLRATFVTVSLANGRTETWVADRTGHRSSVMINRYRRAARTWAELALGPSRRSTRLSPSCDYPWDCPTTVAAQWPRRPVS